MKSNAYQLSARFPGEWNDRYLSYYPRHYARVMTGPEVIDTLATVTKVPMRFQRGDERVPLVKQLSSPGDVGRGGEGLLVDALMQSFFQSNRRTPAQTGNRPSTLQALLMMQSTVVNDRVRVDAKGQIGEGRNEGQWQVVDTEEAEILERANRVGLSRSRQTGDDDEVSGAP